ncbi:hypothetical protein QUF80_03240 [Desulfococcaceae bacterium HSG8]|nr:hypothetical protein [Desulfococcaceae bacterium HSG8]
MWKEKYKNAEFPIKSQIGQDGVLNLQLPVTLANQKVEIVLVINTETDKKLSERPIGLYAGKMKMSEDFSEPLPEEMIYVSIPK